MVVFTCNHCGESLQKPRVEKHYSFSCRTEKFLTCVDCFKDFKGDEYTIHIKCVSEEQRYSGKDYVEKTKKGEVKQESWMEMIKSIMLHEPNMKSHHKQLLKAISNYDNVPRKRAKFINFIKSSTAGRTNISDIEAVWDIIERYKTRNMSTNENNMKIEEEINETVLANLKKKTPNNETSLTNNHENNNGETDISKNDLGTQGNVECEAGKTKKHKKRKNKDSKESNNLEDSPHKKTKLNIDMEETCNENNYDTGVCTLNGCISEILLKNKVIFKEKLYKKVIRKYRKSNEAATLTDEKLQRKINKKLKKLENVIIEDDVVKLVKK